MVKDFLKKVATCTLAGYLYCALMAGAVTINTNTEMAKIVHKKDKKSSVEKVITKTNQSDNKITVDPKTSSVYIGHYQSGIRSLESLFSKEKDSLLSNDAEENEMDDLILNFSEQKRINNLILNNSKQKKLDHLILNNSEKNILDNIVKVKIYTKNEGFSSGNGLMLTQNGFILTAYHVIDELYDKSKKTLGCVIDNNNSVYRIDTRILATNKKLDLAIIKAEVLDGYLMDSSPINIKIASNNVRNGDMVQSCSRKSGKLYNQLGKVIKSHIKTSETNLGKIYNTFETDIYSKAGFSGSPFISSDGELSGILLYSSGDLHTNAGGANISSIRSLVHNLCEHILNKNNPCFPVTNFKEYNEYKQEIDTYHRNLRTSADKFFSK